MLMTAVPSRETVVEGNGHAVFEAGLFQWLHEGRPKLFSWRGLHGLYLYGLKLHKALTLRQFPS